jgi:AraC-like DNA-binding protein
MVKSSQLPLSGHTVLQTRDIGTAEQTLSRCYLPLRLRTTRPGTPLDARLNAMTLGRATVGAIGFDSEVRIVTEEAENFHVDIPLSGVAVSGAGTAQQVVTKPGAAQVFMPGERADLRWSGTTRQLCVMVQTPALESHLSSLLGTDLTHPIAFRPTMDLRSPGGQTWMHVLKLVDHELRRDEGLLGHGLMRRTLERLLIESLLLGHQHNYSSQLQLAPERSGSGAIRTAIELVEAHPERPWSVGELAAEVGSSVRALHAGFRDKTDLGPMTYLRRIRLARVHEDLLHADPASTTVASIARHWGFAHLGRFAASYAQRYGQSPSTTLRGSGANLDRRTV